MKANYHIIAIVSDTAPNANAYGIGRKIQVTANTKAQAVKLANAFYFIMAGHNIRFSPFQLSDFKPYVKRLCKSSACRNYHVEIWRDGVTFDDIPESSAERRKKEKGNKADWRTESQIVNDALNNNGNIEGLKNETF